MGKYTCIPLGAIAFCKEFARTVVMVRAGIAFGAFALEIVPAKLCRVGDCPATAGCRSLAFAATRFPLFAFALSVTLFATVGPTSALGVVGVCIVARAGVFLGTSAIVPPIEADLLCAIFVLACTFAFTFVVVF